ncbi:unnamed protein product [Medioppia subpectinata]|uniref:Gustatory receptor n=1 Tax=Medioppia subpectinata TaxID=1979941 RepID=A0A7R9KSY1_9ACAR|nr:unnamed protein product [Medioppia subpectinata]CAG2108025.1 unnamed protein product [Medioppia subpectinata]
MNAKTKRNEFAIVMNEKPIKQYDQKFYSAVRPTLFLLRFLGGPTGLWKVDHGFWRTIVSTITALLMLLVLNVCMLYQCVRTVRTVMIPGRSFNQNVVYFFDMAINFTGVMALDILWVRRKELISLLNLIDLEPKVNDNFDDDNTRKNRRKIRSKTTKLLIFLLFFTALMVAPLNINTNDYDYYELQVLVDNHITVLINIASCLSTLAFGAVLSLYLVLSWVLRLKVCRIVAHLKNNLLPEAQKGRNPRLNEPKLIQTWFTSYAVIFKKYNMIFKQIAGLIFVVLLWSVLSMSNQIITFFVEQIKFLDNIYMWIHEVMCAIALILFLFVVSSVEYKIDKLMKQLFHLALVVKFNYFETKYQTTNKLAQNFKLLADTIYQSHLSLSIFGLFHITRGLIVTTFGFAVTYTVLMYELTKDDNIESNPCNDTTLSTQLYSTPIIVIINSEL